jgi:hypothetical protein
MKEQLALRVLSRIMDWDDEKSRVEFRWLRLMAYLKYDGYRDYTVGVRFVESLAGWLQQFDKGNDREVAYAAARRKLVFVSAAEYERLVELLYPNRVRPRIVSAIAKRSNLQPYEIWRHAETRREFKSLLRRSLFMALSDGARLDTFRRVNAGRITNEQILPATQIDDEKWDDLLKELRNEEGDDARFAFVFLIDDFMGTGTTLIRDKNGRWTGKLQRFWESVQDKVDTHFADDWVLAVHHYVGTSRADSTVRERVAEAKDKLAQQRWFTNVELTFESVLPVDLPLTKGRDDAFIELANRYYDASLETKHTRVGGTDMRLGFAGCALPVVLEHNAPNNSVSLIWAETTGAMGVPMRPLFRRRQRHVE